MASFIPTNFKIALDIDDADILKIGVVIWLAVVGWKLLK